MIDYKEILQHCDDRGMQNINNNISHDAFLNKGLNDSKSNRVIMNQQDIRVNCFKISEASTIPRQFDQSSKPSDDEIERLFTKGKFLAIRLLWKN